MLISIIKSLIRKWENRDSLKTLGAQRHPRWSALRDEFIKDNPFCEACGVKAETVHHCIPFSTDPSLELKKENLLSLCDECHLVLAHLKSFRRHDKDIKKVALEFRNKIKNYD